MQGYSKCVEETLRFFPRDRENLKELTENLLQIQENVSSWFQTRNYEQLFTKNAIKQKHLLLHLTDKSKTKKLHLENNFFNKKQIDQINILIPVNVKQLLRTSILNKQLFNKRILLKKKMWRPW